MSTNHTTPSYTEIGEEASNWLVGGGIVTMALFPLALPAIALIAIAAVPLLLVALAGALVAGLVVLPIRLIRLALRAQRGGDRQVEDVPVIAPAWQMKHREQTP